MLIQSVGFVLSVGIFITLLNFAQDIQFFPQISVLLQNFLQIYQVSNINTLNFILEAIAKSSRSIAKLILVLNLLDFTFSSSSFFH
ncbi:MAG: hypothetical protein ACTSUG_12330 [Candidatus Helarchaeota archaeon]